MRPDDELHAVLLEELPGDVRTEVTASPPERVGTTAQLPAGVTPQEVKDLQSTGTQFAPEWRSAFSKESLGQSTDEDQSDWNLTAARPNCKSRSAPYRKPHRSRRETDRAPDGSLTETAGQGPVPNVYEY
ncbi:hypothetical protein Bbelb_310490 [Branchiostoma belcheri]|nr:hypothetical protein Bbelb_310490 [Branchiostoma belcheri]